MMPYPKKFNPTEYWLEELLFRVHQFINTDGFRESGLDVALPIMSHPIIGAYKHLQLLGHELNYGFPEFNIPREE